jgi:hypothetical protein
MLQQNGLKLVQELEQKETAADLHIRLLGPKLERSAFMAKNSPDSSPNLEKLWMKHIKRQEQQRQEEQQSALNGFWDVLYSQYGSAELRREFYDSWSGINRPMYRLSSERKAELLIQDMTETLAFSSPVERATLHSEWEWDMEAQSDKLASLPDSRYGIPPYSWGDGWCWEKQSKRRRARALSRLDFEFAILAEQSTEMYLVDAAAAEAAGAAAATAVE